MHEPRPPNPKKCSRHTTPTPSLTSCHSLPLSHVVTAKGGEAAVPKLNDHQPELILDIGLRNLDLPGLTGKAALDVYNRIKSDAFDAKAFQHTVRPQDRAEEATLLALVTLGNSSRRTRSRMPPTMGRQATRRKTKMDAEVYCRIQQGGAIQKVISNKRSAAKRKTKADKTKTKADDAREGDTGEQDAGESAPAESRGWSKLLGLAAYS
ncbi:hypothetical protein B0H17DRAFT_1203267, partial [Mycena rosella]